VTTVIATRTAIYSDSACTDYIPHGIPKLYRIDPKKGQPFLCGIAGFVGECHLLMNLLKDHGLDEVWNLHYKVEGHTQRPDWLDFEDWNSELLIVTQDKQILRLDESLIPLPVEEQKYAIGSGSQWAIAAMDHGRPPKEAIEYASTRDPFTKAPVRVLTFRSR
jgi:ATP-dependent protease HslVU (ClpYQ) peptidase subunit